MTLSRPFANRYLVPLVVLLCLLAPIVTPQSGANAASPVVAGAVSKAGGYWTTDFRGAVAAHEGASFFGDTSQMALNRPVVTMADTNDGRGYWLVAGDGGIFTFGNAPFYGSTGGMRLNEPIVGMAATSSGGGYWLVASDGGIFSFGDARFHGSTGGIKLNRPIVGMAATNGGSGYWLVASDGGIFSFGDAAFHGSTGGKRLNSPVVGMAATPSGLGYWLGARDGGIFSFGDAAFHGSGVGRISGEVTSFLSHPSGYRLVDTSGRPITFSATAPVTSPPTGVRRFITPTGAGNRDGGNWGNAAPLTSLNSVLGGMAGGGEVLLRADVGSYTLTSPLSITRGATAEAPISIRGALADGSPAASTISSNRADPYSATGPAGSELFRLDAGANHLRFSYLQLQNFGNGAFRVRSDITGLELSDITARNFTRFIESEAGGSATSASVRGLVVDRVRMHGFSKSALHLDYDSSNIVIRDTFGDSQRQDGANFAMGVHVEGTTQNVRIIRTEMHNSHDSVNAYWNGDGFTMERGVRDVYFEDTVATGHTDAGYDLKSSNTTLVRARASDNKRNFRLWSSAVLVDCVGSDPNKRGGTGSQNQVWVGTAGTSAVIQGGRFIDDSTSTTVFELEPNTALTVQQSEVTKNASARLLTRSSGARLSLNGVPYG